MITTMSAMAGCVAAMAAAVGLVLNYLAFRKHARETQLELFNSVRAHIQAMTLEWAKARVWPSQEKQLWDATFFNELEWLAFLLRHGDLPFDLILDHYGLSILGWYEGMFVPHVPEEDKNNENAYADFKWLVEQIRLRNVGPRPYVVKEWTASAGALRIRTQVLRCRASRRTTTPRCP
jgi:hypothetical protein